MAAPDVPEVGLLDAGDALEPDTGLSDTEDTGDGDAAGDDGALDTDALEIAEDVDGGDSVDVELPTVDGDLLTVTVLAMLDGEPAAGVTLVQGGRPVRRVTTGEDGLAALTLDLTVVGELAVVASHPEARTGSVPIDLDVLQPVYTANLSRFETTDNPNYEFLAPGTPEHSPNTGYCGHCHVSINQDWFGSVHRDSAKNPALLDLYAGAAGAVNDAAVCAQLGGTWATGPLPGTDTNGERCYVGAGVLPTLNDCGLGDCEAAAEQTGACADCHAPGIGGVLGGRGLHEAQGDAFDFGVHCDVCHRVESVELDAEPGVAGRLRLLRPAELATGPGLGTWQPLTFGPSLDSPNPRMGMVPREHFRTPDLCAGCHEQQQAVLVPGVAIDTARWPTGKLPIHTTFSEWQAGPMNPGAPCQSCHMPPNPLVANSADQQLTPAAPIGIVAGWLRPPGQTNHHSWDGPRALDSGMLELAAALFTNVEVVDGVLEVTVRTKNAGPGHAIPTGEPMRALVLTVSARCGNTGLVPVGGDVIPDFGGAIAQKAAGEDWNTWPDAQVGDVIRVIARDGYRDYTGYGPFGDGTFTIEQKGLRQESLVGQATVVSVENSVVTLDTPLPEGDVAWLTRDERSAGAPGFAFARVLVDQNGAIMVPHFLATDVRSDNRLAPQQSMTTVHRFAAACADPEVTASLYHRAYPPRLVQERGWTQREVLMTRSRRVVTSPSDP